MFFSSNPLVAVSVRSQQNSGGARHICDGRALLPALATGIKPQGTKASLEAHFSDDAAMVDSAPAPFVITDRVLAHYYSIKHTKGSLQFPVFLGAWHRLPPETKLTNNFTRAII